MLKATAAAFCVQQYALGYSILSKPLFFGLNTRCFLKSIMLCMVKISGSEDGQGNWSVPGIQYETRTLFFKALHNLIERCRYRPHTLHETFYVHDMHDAVKSFQVLVFGIFGHLIHQINNFLWYSRHHLDETGGKFLLLGTTVSCIFY